ncbi:MAG: Rrf2 family transcriptional regulator [Oscillospiraceae bacterium]|nr:Rrf2 family transcriptional regulator [Oscillospiraceae bacterium]
MKISTKGRYALRMLIELAAHQEQGFMSLKEISEHQNISKKYLEQIVPMLNKSGILRTNRGNKGGYMLAKPPRECTVGDVLRATEGSLAPVTCLEYEVNDCPRAESCATLYVWQGLQKAVEDYLDSVTIQDILDRNAGNAGNDYCI